MAHLLGCQNNIESLQQDVRDIHAVVSDILFLVGPVRFPSWKYPDKVSCELDMEELLEIYCYSKDEDHSKLSHIILFELVIERLVLALQGLSQFSDNLLKSSGKEFRPTSSRLVGSSMSVGLVAKKFWNKLVHVQQTVQRLQTESVVKQKALSQMEITITELRDEIKMLMQVVEKKGGNSSFIGEEVKMRNSGKSSAKFILSSRENLSLVCPSLSQDLALAVDDVAFIKTFQETSTQTYDTAFIPCESCARTQKNLIEVGNVVMKVCEAQGLPSSLAKQKKLLKQSLLAAADVSRWAAEQNRDLARINSHLDNLYAQINPLQEKLANSEAKCRNLEKEIRNLENKLQEKKNQISKNEIAFSEKLNEIVQDKDLLLADAKSTNEELVTGKENLEKMMLKLEEDSAKHQNAIKELEMHCENLNCELNDKKQEVKLLQNVESQLNDLKLELETVNGRLRDTSLELDKSQTKNKSLVKHEQALQNKHDLLLNRLDELDSECEGLRDKLEETLGEKEDLQDALDDTTLHNKKLNEELDQKMKILEEIRSEKEKLEKDVSQLETNISTLEGQLKDAEERVQLITEHSSFEFTKLKLNGQNGSDVEVARDMEKKVMANNIRIKTLEQQNEMLRKSIALLSEAQSNPTRKGVLEPLSLWKNDNIEKQDQQEHRSPGCYVYNDDVRPLPAVRVPNVVLPRPPAVSRAESTRHKNSNIKLTEKRLSSDLSTKLASSGKRVMNMLGSAAPVDRDVNDRKYTQGPGQNTADRKSPLSPGYSPVKMLVCSDCDKMYSTQRDLDIHKSFCYGRIS